MQLRPYQQDAIDFLMAHIAEGRHCCIAAPTGSGKSFIITELIKLLGHHNFLLCAPQEHLEHNFNIDKAVAREIGLGKAYTGFSNGAHQVMVTSHQALARRQPVFSAKGNILIVDEGHHAGKKTRLGQFIRQWVKDGGLVIYLTATPFRMDGEMVLDGETQVWALADIDYIAQSTSPENLVFRSQQLQYKVDDLAQLLGEDTNKILPQYDDLVPLWEDDGKPKALIILPRGGSAIWARRLVLQFTKAGAKVFSSVGPKAKTKQDLADLLEYERGIKNYNDSKVDVIIACARFDEGTDWPWCSHIYSVGISRSARLLIQRWGRARRPKTIAWYPAEHKNRSVFTMLVPTATKKLWDEYKTHHMEQLVLMACYIAVADSSLARTITSGLRKPSPTLSHLKALLGSAHEGCRKALAAQLALELQGKPTKAMNILEYWEKHGTETDKSAVLAFFILQMQGNEEQKEALEALVRMLKVSPALITSLKDKHVMSKEAVQLLTVMLADLEIDVGPKGVVEQYMSAITGGEAKKIQQKVAKNGTAKDLVQVLRAFWSEHNKFPSNASPGQPFGVTWNQIDNRLRRGVITGAGVTTLSAFLVEQGLKPVGAYEVSDLLQAAKAHKEAHGTWPSCAAKERAVLLFPPRKVCWGSIDQALRKGRASDKEQMIPATTLADLLHLHGLRPPKRRRSGERLTEVLLLEAVKQHRSRYGKWPSTRSGMGPETAKRLEVTSWQAVNTMLRDWRRGYDGEAKTLSQLVRKARGLSLNPCVTEETLKEAAALFVREAGRAPQLGDFLKGRVGLKARTAWDGYKTQPGVQYRSWRIFLQDAGLRTEVLLLTEELILEGIKKFYEKRGRRPVTATGDASEYFGPKDTWQKINYALMNGYRGLPGGSSLYKFFKKHEAEITGKKPGA